MSLEIWRELPKRFLKLQLQGWLKLNQDARSLIFELAQEQKFKCALCEESTALEIEHDHDPQFHPGNDKYTVYNIRGLACRRCNWLIGLYEKDKKGEVTYWQNVPYIPTGEIQYYLYAYECRVRRLLDKLEEQRVGSLIFWRKRNLLDKFDEWREHGGTYPWYWGFNEIKDKKYGRIRSMGQFFEILNACLKYISEERARNPDYEPSPQIYEILYRIKPFLDELRPIWEQRSAESRN